MLGRVRIHRWLIALLLLLCGQAGGLAASTDLPCPRSQEVELGVVAADAGLALLALHAGAPGLTPEHGLPGESLPTASAAAACAAVALVTSDPRRDAPVSGSAAPPVAVDAALARLLVDAFFRPPRTS